MVVFITGASSGIGRETAKFFAKMGYNVAATMRQPEKEKELCKIENIKLFKCDVTNLESIKNAVSESISVFGEIDILVNNAGFYTIGAFETATDEQISAQLDTNLKGLMLVTREVLPVFRKKKSGVIVNLSSIAGLTAMPIQSLYHASKWAIEGFSESLQYELRPFGIKVKIIEPGVINTDFYGRSKTVVGGEDISEYREYSDKIVRYLVCNGEKGSEALEVAKTIFKAATDNKNKLRYRVGKLKYIILLKRFLPHKIYTKLIRMNME